MILLKLENKNDSNFQIEMRNDSNVVQTGKKHDDCNGCNLFESFDHQIEDTQRERELKKKYD